MPARKHPKDHKHDNPLHCADCYLLSVLLPTRDRWGATEWLDAFANAVAASLARAPDEASMEAALELFVLRARARERTIRLGLAGLDVTAINVPGVSGRG